MPKDGSLTSLDELIVSRYMSGESVTRLTVGLGVSRAHVRRALKRAAVPRRSEPTLSSMPPGMRARIIRAHKEGLTGPEAANLVSVDRALVYQVWKDEGLQRRQPRKATRTTSGSNPRNASRRLSPGR